MQADQFYTNALIHSSSPYLKQHAHNPVDWMEWSEEALEKAKREKKLLLISVGYAACHWCHVMAHQSFEDKEVANLMNKHFICIKVDREERPDIDQIYMMAAQLSTGHGGWPLNAFALPDGRPFYGATYFPKDQWMEMLRHMANLFDTKKEELEAAAESLSQGIRSADQINLNPNAASFTKIELEEAFNKWKKNIDFEKGGDLGRTEQTPKFPMPNNWEFLMDYTYHENNEEARQATVKTLDAMALGGIYDHIGGGFTRYSTDQHWLIPHFEKMLYDNAQLIHLYSRAYQWTGNEQYKQTVYETVDWLERELMSDSYGFYSSLDADSEGIEGKFYVWTFEELKDAAGDDWSVVNAYYKIPEGGNFEGKINLSRPVSDEYEVSKETSAVIQKFNEKLLSIRSTRIRPGLDDKIITSWNALTIRGLTRAYRAFGDERFLKLAMKNAAFLKHHVISETGLNRIVKDGTSSVNGFLDDYSFTIEGFIELYMATFDETWLTKSNELVKVVTAHFDAPHGLFYYTSDEDPSLIARPMELSDNVISSSNASMANALHKLGHLLDNEEYLNRSKQMLECVKSDMEGNLRFYSYWGSLYLSFLHPPYEVAIVGAKTKKVREQLDEHLLPDVYVLGGQDEGQLPLLKNKLVPGKTMIYVCQNKTCDLPTDNVGQALGMLTEQ